MEDKAEEIAIKEGDYVHYTSGFGKPENGRVKFVKKGLIFVVYKCNNEWEHYQEYTGCATNVTDIRTGWIDDQGNKIKTPDNKNQVKNCDHHYIPTNAKWQSATQRQCCHCGHVID